MARCGRVRNFRFGLLSGGRPSKRYGGGLRPRASPACGIPWQQDVQRRVTIRCIHQLRVEACGNVAERSKAVDEAWGGRRAYRGKYPMKQSTGLPDVSIRAWSTAPRGVAMAIRFMQRNLDRLLTTGEIAAAAITSERSLRRQFQCFTGQSPIAYHRLLRLEAARHALCDNHPKADITTAAGMHGFNHLSHFTGQYRRRYGELPSATLRALREGSLPLPSHAMCEPISLIVLPFICTDLESSNATFAETMTDRVISALTRTRWLNVLSPDSDLPAANNMRVAPPARGMPFAAECSASVGACRRSSG